MGKKKAKERFRNFLYIVEGFRWTGKNSSNANSQNSFNSYCVFLLCCTKNAAETWYKPMERVKIGTRFAILAWMSVFLECSSTCSAMNELGHLKALGLVSLQGDFPPCFWLLPLLGNGLRVNMATGGPPAVQPQGLSLVAFALRAREDSLCIQPALENQSGHWWLEFRPFSCFFCCACHWHPKLEAAAAQHVHPVFLQAVVSR